MTGTPYFGDFDNLPSWLVVRYDSATRQAHKRLFDSFEDAVGFADNTGATMVCNRRRVDWREGLTRLTGAVGTSGSRQPAKGFRR